MNNVTPENICYAGVQILDSFKLRASTVNKSECGYQELHYFDRLENIVVKGKMQEVIKTQDCL